MVKKISFGESDWFTIPFNGEEVLGVIARINKKGIVLCYFFTVALAEQPVSETLNQLVADQAVFICKCGDLALINGEWPLLEQKSLWNRGAWPIPAFGHKDLLTGRYWKRIYAEDLVTLISQDIVTDQEGANLPKDGVYGSRAVARVLSSIVERII